MELAVGASSVVVKKLFELLRVEVNRAFATVKRITGSETPDQQVERPRPEEVSLNSYALLQAYVLMAVTGLGYLALTWSTVVLLGGFVTSLGKKDFWCLTGISMVHAARIFNDSGDNLFPIFLNLTGKLARKVFANPVEGFIQKWYQRPTGHSVYTVVWVQVVLFMVQLLSMPVLVAVVIAGILYMFGPVACIVLSVWRLWQHDYGNTAGDDSKANLEPALNIFYSLVICQGVLFILWWLIDWAAIWVVVSIREECQLPEKWGGVTVVDYLYDTRAKCWRDPTSIDGRNLINYAVDLVDSESQKDYLSGARMLDTFIKREADVRSLLLPSRPKIQKLIDTLGWRSSNRELRELIARIIAYLAGDIHLSQFPGAIQCISSLLDTNLLYWNNQQGLGDYSAESKSKEHTDAKGRLIFIVKGIEEYRAKRVINQGGGGQEREVDISAHGSKGDNWNELILQGLTILERLAFDQHNCSNICSTPDILPKIMAPLYSKTLIRDINVSAWADVANGSLKVVNRLIHAPDLVSKKLAHEISSSKQALSNLESFLEQSTQAGKELQMRAIEILTQLSFDSSTNLRTEIKEKLIKKQLQIFLSDDEGEEEKHRVTAGKTLALISKIDYISMFTMTEQNNIVHRLNETLNAKNSITYRTVALELLENWCTHCILAKNYVKDSLLPKILTEVLSTKRELPKTESKNSGLDRSLRQSCANMTSVIKGTFTTRKHEENQAIPEPRDDEEKQLVSEHNDQIKSSKQANAEQNAKMEFQEALLSLILVICDKLIGADDFDEVARKTAPEEGEFVAKLKIIVEENWEARANSLRIVKLCGQIAVTMMGRSQYTAHFKDQKFVETLTEASRIMYNLESCMHFAGTDGGGKKTDRGLLWEVVKEAQAMVA